MSAKNVLYFAENAISPVQGGGIVVYAALKGLPPENLLGVYQYRHITPAAEYADRLHPLSSLLRSENASRANTLPSGRLGNFERESKSLDIGRAILGPLLDRFAGGFDRQIVQLLSSQGFHPDVVFTAPLSLRMLRLATAAAKHYSVPIVMLNMDDWIAEESARMGPLHGAWERLITSAMAEAKPHIAYAYSNSEKLASVLTERYGIQHDTMNNASHDLFADRRSWNPPPQRTGTVITFAGAMNWHLQGQTLVRVAEAVAELRTVCKIELRIYAPWEFSPLANMISVPGAVTYCGFRTGQELADAYLDSDFLALTTTYAENRIHLFRHSLATKLSDYLCAGRPVLSFGHPDWAVHAYVEQHRCGIATRSSIRSDVKQQIVRAIETKDDERARTGRTNRELWERAHDVRVMAKKVRELLGLESASEPAVNGHEPRESRADAESHS